MNWTSLALLTELKNNVCYTFRVIVKQLIENNHQKDCFKTSTSFSFSVRSQIDNSVGMSKATATHFLRKHHHSTDTHT